MSSRMLSLLKNAPTKQHIRRSSGLSLVDLSLGHSSFFDRASNQNEMVDALIATNHLDDTHLISAFREVDRAMFCRLGDYSEPYRNVPIKISKTGATMSSPTHHAIVSQIILDHVRDNQSTIEAEHPDKPFRFLDVGFGGGYLLALFYKMFNGGGVDALRDKRIQCIGCEVVEELFKDTKSVLESFNIPELRDELSSGFNLFPAYEDNEQSKWNSDIVGNEYDCIHIGFATDQKEIEDVFVPLLRSTGVLVAPMTIDDQRHESYIELMNEHGIQAQQMFTKFVRNDDGSLSVTPVAPVLCPSKEGRMRSENVDSNADRLKLIQEQLDLWKNQFEKKSGRKPNRADMMSDDEARELFQEFSSLRRNAW